MTLALSLLILILFLLGLFHVVKKQEQKVWDGNQMPPGAWGLPLLGHLISLGFNPHLTLMKWKKKYGPIIRCQFGSFPTVVLCDSKLIKEALNMSEFSGRGVMLPLVEGGFQKGIMFSEGPYNTELRQFAIRQLKDFGMGRTSLENQIHDGIGEFMDFIKAREGLPIESENVPASHLLRTLWSIVMTDQMKPEKADHLNYLVDKSTQLGSALSELAGFMPWLEKLTRLVSFGHFSLTASRTDQFKEFYEFFASLLQEKERKAIQPEGNSGRGQCQGQGHFEAPTVIMDFFLEKVKGTTDESSPFHKLKKTAPHFLGDMFAAGIHTNHTALLWLFNYMAGNPEVQKKLQEEIDEVIGSGNDLSRLPSLSDRGQMPYADAIVFELLRISSVVPFALPHKVTADVRFHGYTLKKDTLVFVNLYGVHHDPDPGIWGDPENFRPERWFGYSGKKLKSNHFLAFSTGKRNCPGEAFGRDQLFLYLTTLFQRYNVQFYEKSDKEVKGVFGIFLAPSNFTVVFSQRKNNKR